MLLGTLTLGRALIKKCYAVAAASKKPQHASSARTDNKQVDQGQSESVSEPPSTMAAVVAEQTAAGPASMDVDRPSTPLNTGEWTQDEMKFMRAALEQVRSVTGVLLSRARKTAPAVVFCRRCLLPPTSALSLARADFCRAIQPADSAHRTPRTAPFSNAHRPRSRCTAGRCPSAA